MNIQHGLFITLTKHHVLTASCCHRIYNSMRRQARKRGSRHGWQTPPSGASTSGMTWMTLVPATQATVLRETARRRILLALRVNCTMRAPSCDSSLRSLLASAHSCIESELQCELRAATARCAVFLRVRNELCAPVNNKLSQQL